MSAEENNASDGADPSKAKPKRAARPAKPAGPAKQVSSAQQERAAQPERPADSSPAVPPPAVHARRFKRREVELGEGGKLVVDADGSIRHVDGEGQTKQTWTAGDPDWERHAIRFGLRTQTSTVRPPGRRSRGTKPLGA